jgi:nucleoside 2-deoxyribosyltransferase
MSKYLVYLAGPISGLDYDAATKWRLDVANELYKNRTAGSIEVLSPLRSKSFLKDKGIIEGSYDDSQLATSKGILTRDRNDILRSDFVIFNFLGAKDRVSIGTCCEVSIADCFRKPSVLVIEDEGNPHDHPFITESCGYRVNNLEDAVDLTINFLMP